VVELTVQLALLPPNVNGARVRGTVVNANTNAPLVGVQIAVTAGAPRVSATTAAAGTYSLDVQPGTLVTLTASLAGFDPVTISVPLIQDQVLEFSPRLYPEGQSPTGANRAEIRGVVVNQANRQPIENALIVVTDPSGQQSLRSDANGRFSIRGLSGPNTGLSISADAFEPATVLVPLLPLEVRDIGRIGLKPTTISFYLPDLAIADSTLATTDPDLFSLSQRFEVQVVNRGTSTTTQDFTLLAFVDANGNGSYERDTEPEVGRTRAVDDLPIGGSANVAVAVSAQLNFRDAPIAFWVDAENEIPEQIETNNTGSSLLGCRVEPALIAADNVYEAWRWRELASNPQINSLSQVPTVAQLTDDNGDGAINQYDIPDVVLVAGRRSSIAPSQTALVAISGTDGRELWARSDAAQSHFSGTAVGDIDNDGIAEIVVVAGYRSELFAYEHTGQLKWRRPLDGPGIPRVLFPPPPFVYDQPIIANLEGDQEAEIILGREAFRGFTGEQLWEGEFDAGGDGGKPATAPLRVAFGIGSVAVDLNMDGVLEVVAGRTAYDFEGRTVWHRADIKPEPYEDAGLPPNLLNSSGLVGIGNFDLDDFPEVVLSIDDELYLLEHTGQTIWGPKFAPDFGEMGAPSVADLDADGLPEVIISSNTRLTVFESDGTVKWTATIRDESGVTSATVFDFQNDGLYEVIHLDEQDFRIFDALTGTLLYETRNTSPTVYEYPVVADIDGDKQAEIIITGFDRDLQAGVTPGLRVFKARNGAWADAGSVWGSHAFHIDEIAEDSTVPLIETPSWLTHNTYRVQRSPLPDPLGMPDFSVGDLRLTDQGPGRNPTVQVRVGNAGPVDSHEPPFISVWRGNPAAGGTRLTQVRLDTLRPARFQDVNLGEVTLAGSGELYAVVDQADRARECRETNNQRVIPFSATNGIGDLQLTTDRPSYSPGDSVAISARVANLGALPAGYRVEWSVRDSGDRVTATLDPQNIATIAAGTNITRVLNWPSSGVVAATYTVAGTLLNDASVAIDTATTSFQITGTSGPAGALSLTAGRASYAPGLPAQLTWRVQNLSASESIRLPEVAIDVVGPNGFRLTRVLPLSDLFPAAFLEGDLSVDGALVAGTYNATARLRSRLTGVQYATAATSFERQPDAAGGLVGFVDVARANVPLGENQTCLFTVRNRGTQARVGATLRRRVVSLLSGTTMLERTSANDVAVNADLVLAEPVPTTGFVPTEHACVLETQNAGNWVQLDAEPFNVLGSVAPGIIVEPTSGLVTSEAGTSAQFAIRLATVPTADVRITLEPSDATEWRLPNTVVTISPATWDVPRQVTVVGVDDSIVDGDQTGTIRVLPAESADVAYNMRDGADVSITNRDDETVGIAVFPTSIETSEVGTTATISLSLNSAPTADVVVGLSVSDTTEWSLSATSVTFRPVDWSTPRIVTVTGLDDPLLDGTISGQIITAAAVSADSRYQGLNPVDVAASNVDNESSVEARIVVVPTTGLIVSESGGTDTFTIALTQAPTAPVTIALTSGDATEFSVSPPSVSFGPTSFGAQTITITGIDDAITDGNIVGSIVTGAAQSTDSRYGGVDPSNVSVTNLDNETVNIAVNPSGTIETTEAGGSAIIELTISTQPTADVVVPVTNPDPTEWSMSRTELRFTPGNWQVAQALVVSGVDDSIVDGDIAGVIALGAMVSSDANYSGINPPDVPAVNRDNDAVSGAMVLIGDDLIVSEAGDTGRLTLSLNRAPSGDVRLAISSSNPSEVSVSPAEVVITPAMATAPQAITLRGADDFIDDGDQTVTISIAVASSADPGFAGLAPQTRNVVNLDNDQTGIGFTLSGPAQIVEGQATSFNLVLASEPRAPVTLNLAAALLPPGLPNDVDFTLLPATVVVTPATWRTPVAVRLQTRDNGRYVGDRRLAARISSVSSGDALYAAIATNAINVTVLERGGSEVRQIPVNRGLGLLFLLLCWVALSALYRQRKELAK
jgi:hypothetical protein